MIYLATPYTDTFQDVQAERAKHVCYIVKALALRGQMVYSPIAHGHYIEAIAGPVPYTYWIEHGLKMLSMCSMLMVVKMAGWKESKGIKEEIKYAKSKGIPVVYVEDSQFLGQPCTGN